MVTAIMVATFILRFVTVDFYGDHFDRISRGRQILATGEMPFRDFFDPGYSLTVFASAAAQAIKVFFFPLTLLACWLFARRPATKLLAVLACATVLAGLFRHGSAAYAYGASVATVAATYRRRVAAACRALATQPAPVVVVETRRAAQFAADYPLLDRYFQENYRTAAESTFGELSAPELRILLDGRRAPTSTYWRWALPCYS